MVGSMVLFAHATGISSPWFSVTAGFVLLGIMDIFRPYLSLALPRALHKSSDWERTGIVYRYLGVIAFGRFLQKSPLRYLNRWVYLTSNSRDWEAVRSHVAWSEAAHFWAAVLTIPYLAVALARGWWSVLAALLVFDVAVNLYPILHLRWVRTRLDRALPRRRRLQGHEPNA